jgi:hypothetical protein
MKRIIVRMLAVAGLAAMLAAPSWAKEGDLDKAAKILQQQARGGRGEFITFLIGAATAYRWAGTADVGGQASPLYCAPPDAKLDGRAYANIALQEYGRAKAEYQGMPEYPLTVLALALLRGLQDKFPCRSAGESPAATSH